MSDNKADALADIEKVKEVATSSNSFRETILVVEDDKTTRDIIVEYLLDKLPGLSIETASDGVEALDKIAERAPSHSDHKYKHAANERHRFAEDSS